MSEERAYAPSGEQWSIRHGDQEVVVVEVGGGIRSYTAGGRRVLYGYDLGQQCSAGRGQVLMPWPNRVADGRYSFAGKTFQLSLSEPERHNAIHGLARWALWSLERREESSLRVGVRLRPQQGWAWALDLAVEYDLGPDGLRVTPSAVNVGDSAAPFGYGTHPYLTADESQVDDLVMTLPAARAIDVDDRLLPTGESAVSGDRDFRHPRPIGPAQLDTAFTELAADADGRWWVHLSDPATGAGTSMWAQAEAFPFLQVFTGDSLPEAARRTSGVAVEPMTCPPAALNSGRNLLVLEPGQSWSASWGVGPTSS